MRSVLRVLMRVVVWGTRQNAYLDEFYSVVWLKIAPKTAKCCPPESPTIFSFFSRFRQKNLDHRIRKKNLSTSWRSQTPPKPPSTHPPDQAKCTQTCLDAHGRLRAEIYGVLCIVRRKFRRRRGSTEGGTPGIPAGAPSGKSAQREKTEVVNGARRQPQNCFS